VCHQQGIARVFVSKGDAKVSSQQGALLDDMQNSLFSDFFSSLHA
jgi:hypothetical protein